MNTSRVMPVFVSLAVLMTSVAVAEQVAQPNLLLLFVDNVGYGDLGCYGNREAITPRIDRLASEGVRCLDFYIASPSCSPSRGAILTGRHPERNGLNYQMSSNPDINSEGLPVTETILPQYLKPVGYACGAFGKWNIGFDPGQRPTECGFDEFLGHRSGNIHYYKHLYHGQNDMRQEPRWWICAGQYSTDLFADAACGFIRRHASQPWFVYLPFNASHFIGQQNVEPGEACQWQCPRRRLRDMGANLTSRTSGSGSSPCSLRSTTQWAACSTLSDELEPSRAHAGRVHLRQRRLHAARPWA